MNLKNFRSIDLFKACDTKKVFDVQDDSILLFDFKKSNDKHNRVKMSIVKDIHNFPSGHAYEMSSSSNRWSTPFSLDAAGTTGMIECKSDENKTFNVGSIICRDL